MRLRRVTDADAEAAAALVIAVDVKEMGEADYTLADLHDEWREHGFDRDKDAIIAEDDAGTPIGYAHFRGFDVMGVVDPAREGEGAGALLLDWIHRRARERGQATVKQMIGDRGESGRALLEANGYARTRSYWRMEREVNADEPAPQGLRAYDPADAPALYAIREAAFSRNPDYEPATQDTWIARELGAQSFDPELTRVAPGAGFATVRRWEDGVAYLSTLAVDPAAWGRGIGTTLLKGVFAAAGRAGYRHVHLSVASDNPNALRLYERVGMTQRWRVDAYERPVPD